VSESVADALLALGELAEDQKRPTDAAHAYKRLLASASSDPTRARALLGLARAYEAQKLWVPARDTYVETMSRFGNVHLGPVDGDVRLASLISERLSREPFDRMSGDRSEPSLPVPLIRRWERPLRDTARPLCADGVPPSPEASRIFLVHANLLRSVDARSGTTRWEAELDGPPSWVGYLADKIIAATETRLFALRLDTGTVGWTHDLAGPQRDSRAVNPFAEVEAAATDSVAGRYQGFQVVGNRVFCLHADRELLAFDGDTGLVDWVFSPSNGTINPQLHLGPQRIVLQARKPNSILVLDTASGRRIAEYNRRDDEDWARPPLAIDDDRIALVPDPRTVTLFDIRRGVECWVFRESRELPKNGPPLLFGNSERLLVLHDGTDLIRLDPVTGTKRWSRPLGHESLSKRPDAIALDGERVYWANDRTLSAAAIADGTLAWSRYLSGPETGWSLALSEHCVLAYPIFTGSAEGGLEPLPLVFCRRDSGQLVQRLLFPSAPSEVAVRLAPRGALVATQGGLWALGERSNAEVPKSR
jgi:outer membrane protein assembly factor BamB